MNGDGHYFNKVVQEGLSEEVTFPLNTKGWERDGQRENQGKMFWPKGLDIQRKLGYLKDKMISFCWDGMIISFMCQIDWATGCSDLTLSLRVSLRMIPDKISIWVDGLSKVDCSPLQWVGEPHPICWGPEQNKNQGKGGLLPFLPVCWAGTLVCCSSPVLGLGFTPLVPLDHRPSDSD